HSPTFAVGGWRWSVAWGHGGGGCGAGQGLRVVRAWRFGARRAGTGLLVVSADARGGGAVGSGGCGGAAGVGAVAGARAAGGPVREWGCVLVVGSAEYKRRAEGDAAADDGRGVQWEAGLIRAQLYADQQAGRRRVVPVVLPGGDPADLPDWLTPATSTYYQVSEYSVAGAERLLRVLHGRPWETEPPLGPAPELLPRAMTPAPGAAEVARSPRRSEVCLDVSVADGQVRSAVTVAGTRLSVREGRVPAEVWQVWQSLAAGAGVAGQRMLDAGRMLGQALFDEPGLRRVADLV